MKLAWKYKERLFFEWSFRKDRCFRKGLFHQQFQGTILLFVFDFQGLYDYMYVISSPNRKRPTPQFLLPKAFSYIEVIML